MFTSTKIAFAAALILGTASVALAGNENSDERGGFVVPGSTVGVNAVYHPELFGSVDQAGKAYGSANLSQSQKKARSR
jgi:hypothetical protein